MGGTRMRARTTPLSRVPVHGPGRPPATIRPAATFDGSPGRCRVSRRMLGVVTTLLLVLITACGTRSPSATPPPPVVATWSGRIPPGSGSSFSGVTFLNNRVGWVLEAGTSVILHTVDGGAHFIQETLPDHLVPSHLLFFNSQDGLAAASTLCADPGRCETAILRTTDGGQVWSIERTAPYTTAYDRPGASTIASAPSRAGGAVYAVFGGRLLESTNEGSSWTTIPLPPGIAVSTVFFAAPGIGFVGQGCPGPENCSTFHLYATHDNGRSWSPVWSGPGAPSSVRMTSAENGYLLAAPPMNAVSMGGTSGTLYRTTDGGKRWALVQSSWAGANQGGFQAGMQWASGTVGWIPVDAGAGPLIGGLDITADGGVHWTRLGVKRLWTITGASLLSPTDGYIVGSSRQQNQPAGFLLHTTDGGRSWTVLLPGVFPTQSIDMLSTHEGYGLGAPGSPDALLTTSDGGRRWRFLPSPPVGSADVVAVAFATAERGLLLAEPRYGEEPTGTPRAYGTQNGGQSWSALGSVPLSFVSGLTMISPEAGAVAGTSAAFTPRILLTHDGGRHFVIAPYRPPVTYTLFLPRLFLPGQGGQEAAVLSMGGKFGTVGYGPARTLVLRMVNLLTGKVLLTHAWPDTQNGLSYESAVLSMLNDGRGLIYTVALRNLGHKIEKPAAPGTFVKVRGTALVYSLWSTVDGGRHWSAIAVPNAVGKRINPVELDLVTPRTGFLLSNLGIYRTENGGRTWKAVTPAS